LRYDSVQCRPSSRCCAPSIWPATTRSRWTLCANKDLARLGKRIEDGIQRSFGFHTGVVLRSAAELKDVIRRNPFAQRTAIQPNRLVVSFLADEPGAEAMEKIPQIKVGPEELRLDGRELYIHYPDGIGKSKLTPALLERTLKVSGTARNWNTILKLLEMAEQL